MSTRMTFICDCKKFNSFLSCALVVALAWLMSACGGGGGSGSVPLPLPNQAPSVLALSPSSAPAGSVSFLLTVTGANFISGSVITWNGQPLVTTFVSSTQLTANVPASSLTSPASVVVGAVNPAPSGGSSNLNFTITNGVPILSSISPSQALAGGTSFLLTVDGTNFVSGSVVQWQGVSLNTTFVSSTRLQTYVTAEKIAVQGAPQVTVWNPPQGGGSSSATSFTVSPVIPRFAYVAHPGEGLISRMAIDDATGELRYEGYDAIIPPSEGPYSIHVDKSRRFLYALDYIGNRILGFAIDPIRGSLTAIPGSPFAAGDGPVYLVSDPSGNFLYIASINSDDVSGYEINPATGALQPVAGSPFAAGYHPLGVTVDSGGKFLFVANYSGNTISVYSISASSGTLSAVPGSPFPAVGSGPWAPVVDTLGNFLFVPNQDSGDFSAYRVDRASGALTPLPSSPFAVGIYTTRPTVDASGRFLYVPDVADGITGLIYAFSIDAVSGALTPGPGSPFATGGDPEGITLSNDGMHAYVADYTGAEVLVYDVNPQTGTLTLTRTYPTRQYSLEVSLLEAPSQRSIEPKFAFSALEAANSIMSFQVDSATGMLSSLNTVTGIQNPELITLNQSGDFLYASSETTGLISGFRLNKTNGALTPIPGGAISAGVSLRALVFDPSQRFAYASLSGTSEITQYRVDVTSGALTPVASSSLGINPAQVALDPTGQFLYVAQSNGPQLSFYRVDATSGALQLAGSVAAGFPGPWSFAVDPMGRFLCSTGKNAGEVHCYKIYAPDGSLSGSGIAYPGLAPTAIAVDQSGRFIFVTDEAASTVTVYSPDLTNGTVVLVGRFATGASPQAVTVDPSNRFVYVTNGVSQDISVYSFDARTGALVLGGTVPVGSPPCTTSVVGAIR